jgi:glucosyl-dolichyl phosphate glucuronosyltransferase
MTSVAICTLDRPDALRRTLESLERQQTSRNMSVLVVDNSSGGSAHGPWREFAERFSGQADYVSVTEPGLSLCRNVALERAVTEFVAFLDDDVTLPPTWFDALCDGTEVPGTVAAGGPIRLVWEGGRPSWMRREHEKFYSGLELGETERDFRVPSESPFGANFAVNRVIAIEGGGFNTALGRTGNALLGGEEIDLVSRIATRGPVRYLPGAWVNHHIVPERTTRRWLLRRYFAQGQTSAMTAHVHSDPEPSTARSPLRAFSPGLVPFIVAARLGREAANSQVRFRWMTHARNPDHVGPEANKASRIT